MMAVLNLYIDIDRGECVRSVTDGSIAALPLLTQGDSLALRIWLLTGFSRIARYSQVPVAGITLQLAIGTKTGGAGTYYTQQFTWTASTDLGQPYFSGEVPMNTAAITTLLGSGKTAPAYMEIKMVVGGTPTTIYSKPVTINAGVIKDGVDVVPAPLTPLSAEAARAMFVGAIHTGYFDLMNANGKGCRLYVDSDGIFHSDPIT